MTNPPLTWPETGKFNHSNQTSLRFFPQGKQSVSDYPSACLFSTRDLVNMLIFVGGIISSSGVGEACKIGVETMQCFPPYCTR